MSFNTLKSLHQVAIFTTANFVGLGGFLVYYLPNTLCLPKIKEITQIYRKLEPVPVGSQLEELKKEVMCDMNISEKEQKEIELYHLFGFQPMYFGSTWKFPVLGGFNKAIIGIPLSYNQNDINFSWYDVALNGKSINWSTEVGQQLKESVTLSNNAKKFALAQQLYHTSTSELILKAMLTGFLCASTIMLSRTINRRGGLLERSRKFRFSMYPVVVMFNLTLWMFVKDVIRCGFESKADETIATLSQHYIEGGLEYYEKQLKSNICLRTLLGKKGEKLYTLFGNDNNLLRQKHLPITHRKDFFKKKAQESSQQSIASTL